jgi:hypothetical protein
VKARFGGPSGSRNSARIGANKYAVAKPSCRPKTLSSRPLSLSPSPGRSGPPGTALPASTG